jgi:hypothetical protein
MSIRVRHFRNCIYTWLSLMLVISLGSIFHLQKVNAQGFAALTIIPPKFELFGNPGDTINEKIRVRNESDNPVTYSVVIEDFTTTGEEGQVVLEEGDTVSSFSLAKWIETSTKDVILQPKEEKAINFIINIPKNAEPGGHYASILFQAGENTPLEGGGAKVAHRIGSLVLLRVSGNVSENAIIEEFSAPKYQERGPVEFMLRLKNDGNAHVIPQGTIVVTDMFGKKVDEVPLEGRNILPGATRKMTTSWNKNNIMGNFTATMIATYGQDKQPLTASVRFTVIPRLVLILSGIGFFGFFGFISTLFFGRKRISKVLQVIFKG